LGGVIKFDYQQNDGSTAAATVGRHDHEITSIATNPVVAAFTIDGRDVLALLVVSLRE
jgi:hypothetical protein